MKKGDIFNQTFIINNDLYEGFLLLFKDFNPLHTDEDFANEKGFKGLVMHGNILNGFVSYFVGECLPQKNVIIQTQEIKFSLPVYLNEVLEFHAIVSDVFESVNSIEFKYYFRNSVNKKVARGLIQIGLI